MLLGQLIDLAKDAHKHNHYKFKSKEDCFEPSKASFNRLPEQQRKKVAASWVSYLKSVGEFTNEFDAVKDVMYYRFLAQTNLFFLCNLLEKYAQVVPETHEEICNDFFVSKDPTQASFEKFAKQYTDLKERMLLVPRNGFKSSINIADCVQWIICFPEITILILTAVYQLACDFVGELRQHFTLEETGDTDAKGKAVYGPRKLQNKETGEWSLSLFQVLFPEHCVSGEGKSTEFQTPAGGDDKEPTVRAASIEQSLSGMHFGILKLDDVVDNENSQTVTRLAAVNRQIGINKAMLNPFGFFDVIGTWYDEGDYYGRTIKTESEIAETDGLKSCIIGSIDLGRYNSNVTTKIYLRACWWPKDEVVKAGKIEEEMTKDDWDLWFPRRMSYEWLLAQKKKEPDVFPIKYLNNPRKLHKVKFPRELLIRRTIPHTQLPQQGFIVTTVDTAYSTKSWADYTVILTALIFGGRFFIVNMVRGRFNEFELPAVIAATANKWKPKRIAIEDSVGVKWMGRELRREMGKLQISIPVEYVSLGLGNKSKSKLIKAKPVLRLLGDERMFFLNSCEGLQEIYNELEQFTGTNDDPHDDIVSAFSLLADQFGAYADMDARVSYANTQYVADRQAQVKHELIYGLGRFQKYNSNFAIDDNPVTQFQVGKQMETFSDVDPLSDLFG